MTTVAYPPKPETLERPLAAWEKELLAKARHLRQSGKTGILYLTESGAILIFEGVRAGLIAPP